MLRRIETHLFPALGKRPIAEIEAPELLDAFRAIEREAQKNARGSNEIAHRMLQASARSFGMRSRPAAPNASRLATFAVPSKPRKRRATWRRWSESELPDFLKKLRAYDGVPQTKLGLKLLLLTFVRTGELRGAQWSEFELEKAQWRIPAARMKMRSQHIVPLSTQALEIVRELQNVNGGRTYVFSNQADHQKPISENTLLYASIVWDTTRGPLRTAFAPLHRRSSMSRDSGPM